MSTETPEVKPLSEIIPKEYHDRPYLKDLLVKPQALETFAEVFKKLDGAETLIGKRTGIPAADAKPEEWDQFFNKLRPEKADDYEFPTKEGQAADPEFVKVLRDSLHEGGVAKGQAKKFLEKFSAAVDARNAAQVAEQTRVDKEFDTLVQSTFGKDNEKILARVKTTLDENVPAALKPHLAKLDNPSLAIIAGVVNAVLTKYVPEDKLNGAPAGGGGDGKDAREEGRKLMASPEYKDAFHPQHEATVAKIRAIYAELGKAPKK